MSVHDADDKFWAAIKQQVHEECVAYGPEELAAFAEGKLRPALARTLEAHLLLCGECRAVVGELRKELASTQTVYRVAPIRQSALAWKWALAPAALAAVALIVILTAHRPGGPVAPTRALPGAGTTVAQKPTPPAPPSTAGESAQPVAPAPPSATEATPAVALSHKPAPPRRRHAAPRTNEETPEAEEWQVPQGIPTIPEQAIAHAPLETNPLPTELTFAGKDLEKVYDGEAKIDPAAHPELVDDLGVVQRSMPPHETPADAELFAGPQNDLPHGQSAPPAEGEVYK